MVVYGPYERPDGRMHVIHYDQETKKKTTQSYPRYLMEQKLGRKLLPEEKVDHIDGDKTNNNLDNFQILSNLENYRKYLEQNPEVRAKKDTYTCPSCGITFEVFVRRVKGNQQDRGSSGPYCSRSCAGKAK